MLEINAEMFDVHLFPVHLHFHNELDGKQQAVDGLGQVSFSVYSVFSVVDSNAIDVFAFNFISFFWEKAV